MWIPKRLEAGDRLLAVGITQLTLGVDAREFDTGAIRSWVAWARRTERGSGRLTVAVRPVAHPSRCGPLSIRGLAVRRYRDGGRMTDASQREEPIT